MRVWLDDVRKMPEDYDFHVETVEDAIELLETLEVTHVGFDHDLGLETRSGYELACWIEHQATLGMPRITWSIQSDNPVGRKKIKAAMEMADRYWRAAEAMCRNHATYSIMLGQYKGDDDATINWFTHLDPKLGSSTPAQLILEDRDDELYSHLKKIL